MARIKVTGYIDLENLGLEDLDSEHESGLSQQGFEKLRTGQLVSFSSLDDMETEVKWDE